MKSLEEFFKNRLPFTMDKCHETQGITRNNIYVSNVFKPEDYNIDLKKIIIPFCYYICSDLGANKCKYIKWKSFKLEIASFAHKDNENDEDDGYDDEYEEDCISIRSIIYNTSLNDDCRFLWSVNSIIDKVKLHIIPSNPFWFRLTIYRKEVNKELIINAGQTFKSDECVICLTKEPNILFCNCGHQCLCEECDEKHSVSVINSSCIFCDNVVRSACPVCKTENTIKRTV